MQIVEPNELWVGVGVWFAHPYLAIVAWAERSETRKDAGMQAIDNTDDQLDDKLAE